MVEADQEALLPGVAKDGGKGKLIGGIVCVIVLVLLLVVVPLVVFWYVQNTLNGLARTEFLFVQYKWTQEFAHSNLNPSNLSRNSWYPGCGYTADSIGDGDDLSCLSPCISERLFLDMEKSFKEQPAELVRYSSREEDDIETLTLRGWLFTLTSTSSQLTQKPSVRKHGRTCSDPWVSTCC